MKQYYVYILASVSRALYVGITSSLSQRVWEHRHHIKSGHATKYRIDRLVYYEVYHDAKTAIAREKQIKGWRREKKIRLIESTNLGWRDLGTDWSPASDQPLSRLH